MMHWLEESFEVENCCWGYEEGDDLTGYHW